MAEFVVRSAKDTELDPIGDLVARTFANGDPHRYERDLHDWLTYLPNKPGFHLWDCRVGVKDGEIVSHALIEHRTLLYGTAHLQVAGIGRVCTHEAHRRQGYSSQVIQDALTAIVEEGAHLVLLYDPLGYYGRFGFSPVFPVYRLQIETDAIQHLTAPLNFRLATEADIPRVAWLYQQHWSPRVTFQREPALWGWRFLTSGDSLWVAESSTGEIEGYLWEHPSPMNTSEVVVNTLGATRTILSYLGEQAKNRFQESISLLSPPDSALVAFAQQLLPTRLSADFHPTGGWMARVMDTQGLTQTLLPEIRQQARMMNPNFPTDRLLLTCEPDSVQIGLRGDPATFSALKYRDFMQLMFGSVRPTTLAFRLPLLPEATQLLEWLFPPRIATLAGWDWF